MTGIRFAGAAFFATFFFAVDLFLTAIRYRSSWDGW
jgi:hypothetical protein